jgi:Peptidase family C25
MPMRKVFTLLCILLCFSVLSKAQNYGNEWINYSQQYFRIDIVNEGVYKIDYNTLLSVGIPLATTDPRRFQLFVKGQEIPIYVFGENDGVFHANDYIEFYAKGNDAWMDEELFKNATSKINQSYSLFTDTISYYLTWNSSVNNKRFQQENDVNFSSYTASNYFTCKRYQEENDKYYIGSTSPQGQSDPEYTIGEGWFGNDFNVGQQRTYSINTKNVYTLGPSVNVNTIVVGASNYAPLIGDHHLQINYLSTTFDTVFEGYNVLSFSSTQLPSELTSSTSFLFQSINDLNSGSDRNAVASISIDYPHTWDMENEQTFKMYVDDDFMNSKVLANMTNLSLSLADSVIFYDLSNEKRIKVVENAGTYQALIPNSGGEKECYLSSSSLVQNVSLTPVNTSMANYALFIDYSSSTYNNSDYIIITHPSLRYDADLYAAYRNSTYFQATVINIEDLYDQFSYGIRKHPLAIRNYCRYAIDNYNDTIRALFLIGKAYKAGEGSYNYRKSQLYFNQTLVPSMGNPPSDILFTNGIIDTLYQPAIPTGRLAARDANDVALYLEKMILYEAAQNAPYNPNDPYAKEWMKNVLHFAGGGSYSQMLNLKSYLDLYKGILEDTLFGGYVRTFKKFTTAPIQQNQSDSISDLINNGVSILNFFGHAAGIGFDISIENPASYYNYGKYPFLIANSCLAGDLFQPTESSSEAFVLIEDKGTIGYLGSVTQSLDYYLHMYSHTLIKNIGRQMYAQPIGDIIKRTIEQIQVPNDYVKEMCLEMTLHGDPMLKINYFDLPDYAINSAGVFFNPFQVTSEIDSFDVHIVSTNLGRAIQDSFIVEITRIFPDNSTEIYSTLIAATIYKDTILFRLPVDIGRGLGMNQFEVMLDAYNGITEETELNNSITVNLLITSSDIVPIHPYEYAIIPDTIVELIASTGSPFIPATDFIFELDTTDTFDSPFKTSQIINHPGGIVSWTVPTPMTTLGDSMVYYWRVSKNDPGNFKWRESSFQYIPNKRGWGQSHIFQYKKDEYQYVSFNRTNRRFDFVNNVLAIEAQTGYYPYIQWAEELIRVNGVKIGQWHCTGPTGNGLKFAVFNPQTAEMWISNPNDVVSGINQIWQNIHCQTYDVPSFDYAVGDSLHQADIVNFIDSVPDGWWIMAISHRNHNAENYIEDLYQAFESFGSGIIRVLPNNIPYIIYGQKAAPIGSAQESVGTSISDVISLTTSLTSNWNEGYVKSTKIGPATEWGSLHWRQHALAGLQTDSIRLYVLGEKLNGQVDTLIYALPPIQDSLDILDLYNRIDATEYPYLYLLAKMSDQTNHTPAQLDRWQVIYEGVPETALSPAIHFDFYNDTIDEGETITFSIATKNISIYDFPDSLLIKYWIVDRQNNVHPVLTHLTEMHPAGDTIVDTVSFSSLGLPGLNSFWVEVNPTDTTTGNYDQLEQHHFNNIGQYYFLVGKDNINPMLDVTFDGVHILDGDIVSAKPEIRVRLDDENTFLIMDEMSDTSFFNVFLKRPSSSLAERIYFYKTGQEQMRFIPASYPDNVCEIVYPGTFAEDGVYQLIIQASDKSDNESADLDYEIEFEVINKPTITEVLNWPNPFSTSTHFVFTLTGSEIPTYFTIQIMTITGKVVREIEIDELGSIHIGRNITDYTWDGKDDFGDQLANGVYLYRIVTNINGEEIEKNQTSASKYFVKEYGKMYLMR